MEVSFDDIHCIGHSMGAQICGFIGKALVKDKMARITALDPAGLGYLDKPGTRIVSSPLTYRDANLVLVVHTSAVLQTKDGKNQAKFFIPVQLILYLLSKGINPGGFLAHHGFLGHYDFWINGGI